MIITHVRHGRTLRDARNLAAHLLRLDQNADVAVARIVGSAALDLPGTLEAMRRLAPHASAAALHHVVLSPSWSADPAELEIDADRVLREMGCDPAGHPHALVIHKKNSSAGRSELHGHLVVSHWGLDKRGLRDAWLRLRLERLAREIEHDRGQPLVRGRHDKPLAKALRRCGRIDVAEALEALSQPDKPRSAITAKARQKLAREGVSDVDVRSTVKAAWTASDGKTAFLAAIASEGLQVRLGERPGVLLVVTIDGVEVGALDRILRMKRADVAAVMEARHEPGIEPACDNDRTRNSETRLLDRRQDRKAHGAVGATRREGRAVPVAGTARDLNRDSGRATSDRNASGGSREGATTSRPIEVGAGARRNVVREAAARAIVAKLDVAGLKGEATRRFVGRRMAELKNLYMAYGQRLAETKKPIEEPASSISVRGKAREAEVNAARARDAAMVATAKRIEIEALEPRGLRWLVAWAFGDLARHQAEVAKREDERRRAAEWRIVMDQIARGMDVAAKAEAARARIKRLAEVERRRDVEETARRCMECARIAVDLLKRDPKLADQSLDALMRVAEIERQRRDATDRERDLHRATQRMPRPR